MSAPFLSALFYVKDVSMNLSTPSLPNTVTLALILEELDAVVFKLFFFYIP